MVVFTDRRPPSEELFYSPLEPYITVFLIDTDQIAAGFDLGSFKFTFLPYKACKHYDNVIINQFKFSDDEILGEGLDQGERIIQLSDCSSDMFFWGRGV